VAPDGVPVQLRVRGWERVTLFRLLRLVQEKVAGILKGTLKAGRSAPPWAVMVKAPVFKLARVLPGVLAHLVRNAVAHGIEAPEEREASGKPRVGTIRIAGGGGDVAVVVEDDGRGVDEELVRARAESMQLPLAEYEDLIFEPGLSTRASVDGLAGRGVGLDAVRSALAEAGYAVSFDRVDGRISRFVIFAEPAPVARMGT
jgi:sensor histidine kinase regulating citrate/malate metabolism